MSSEAICQCTMILCVLFDMDPIGPLNLISVSLPPPPPSYSPHVFLASRGCELADTIYILPPVMVIWCTISALLCHILSFCRFVLLWGWGGTVFMSSPLPFRVLLPYVHAFVTYRYIQ